MNKCASPDRQKYESSQDRDNFDDLQNNLNDRDSMAKSKTIFER